MYEQYQSPVWSQGTCFLTNGNAGFGIYKRLLRIHSYLKLNGTESFFTLRLSSNVFFMLDNFLIEDAPTLHLNVEGHVSRLQNFNLEASKAGRLKFVVNTCLLVVVKNYV